MATATATPTIRFDLSAEQQEQFDEIPADKPTHHWAWVYSDGDAREITRAHRNVLEYHPRACGALKQELEAEDESRRTHRFTGEAIAMSPVPTWPNAAGMISVYRWEDEQGRESHGTHQEVWFDDYQRAMERLRTGAAAA